MKTNRKGFTLVEIMIVVAIIGILAVIAIPNFLRARRTSQANSCIANMKQIVGAVEAYRLAGNQDLPTVATLIAADGDDGSYIKASEEPKCPVTGQDGASYTVAEDGVTCPNHDDTTHDVNRFGTAAAT
jgi:prepilin-type N-terminal cleavage/methylation domain-containing protein